MSGAPRPRPTATAAATLAAAMAQARTRLAGADAAATRSAARIADTRWAAVEMVGDTETRLRRRTRAAAAGLNALARRRRRVAVRLEWRIRVLQCRTLALEAVLLWHRVSRVLAVAVVAAACLWAGIKLAALLRYLAGGP